MFGKKVTKPLPVEDNTPDMIVEHVGMRGFTPDPEPVKAPEPASQPVPAPAPMQAEQPKYSYQVVSAELIDEGLYKFTLVTNKVLGEIGGIYEA